MTFSAIIAIAIIVVSLVFPIPILAEPNIKQPPGLLITNISPINMIYLPERGIKESNMISGSEICPSGFDYHESQRLAKENIFIGDRSAGNFIDLQDGNILLNPEKNIVIGAGPAKIYVDSQTILFIMKSGNNLTLYNLHQSKSKPIFVIACKHKLKLESGQMLVLTDDSNDDFAKLNVNCHSVSFSNVRKYNLDNNNKKEKIFLASFSLTSALTTIEPLRRLILSKNEEDNFIINTLVKDIIANEKASPTIPGIVLSK